MASLAKNTAFLTIASILQKAVAFLYFTAIARTIGVTNTGAYFLALALVTTIGTIADVGVNSVLIRDSARSPEHTKLLLRRVLGIKLIAAPLAILLAIFLPVLLGYDAESVFLVRLAIIVMLADTISLTMYGALRGAQNLRYEALGIFIGQSITTIIGITVLFFVQASLPMLIVALFAGSLWNACYSAFQIGKRFGWDALLPLMNGIRPIFLAAVPFFLAAVFVKLYSSFDSYTLQAVIGMSAVGIYSVANKLTYAFQFLPLAFVGALYPKMSSLVDRPDDLKKVFLDAQWYLALLVAPIAFGLFALAPEIINLMYGAEYQASVLPLSILIFVLIPIFFDYPVGSLLNACGRQKIKTIIMGITMVVNIIANLICIPRFGVVGASIAGCITFVVMFGLGVFAMRKIIHVKPGEWGRAVGGFLVAGIGMAAMVILGKAMLANLFPHVPIAWVALIPFGAAVFFLIAFMLKSLTKDHLLRIKQACDFSQYGKNPFSNE